MDQLISVFGSDFLCYVLACEQEHLRSVQPPWSEEQLATISQLENILVGLENYDDLERQEIVTTIALTYQEESATTTANTWRRRCGGTVDSVSATLEEDSCLYWLETAARDMYPGFLLPGWTSPALPHGESLGVTIYKHPAFIAFCKAVLKDEKLKRLFPEAPEEIASVQIDAELIRIASEIILSMGRGGGIQLSMLLDILLKVTYDRLLISGDANLRAYMTKPAEVMEEVRSLSVGRTMKIPVVIGMRNITLPEGVVLRLPWGVIRNIREGDKRFVPKSGGTTAVLVVHVPTKVLSKRPSKSDFVNPPFRDLERHVNTFENYGKELGRLVSLTRYSFLIASTKDRVCVPIPHSTCILDPFRPVPSMSYSADQSNSTNVRALGSDEIANVLHWAKRLEVHPRTLDIAVRRTLSAIVDRVDPLDGFIDAVLAWENMFSDSPETTMKVCGAIAVLLERYSFESRNILFKELQSMYRTRSSVVHGSSNEPSLREAVALRDKAVEVSLDAMRALYEQNDMDLLNADSASRGKQILLGALDV